MSRKKVPATMTQAEYARYRDVAPTTVQGWKRRGLLVMTKDGKRVDVKRSDALLARTLNQVRSGMKRPKDRLPEIVDYSRMKAQESYLRSVRLRMEIEREAGGLLRRDQLEPLLKTAAAMAREALLSIADRTAPLVAVESDDGKCHAIIDREVRRALDDYCRMLDQALDGDGGDRTTRH